MTVEREHPTQVRSEAQYAFCPMCGNPTSVTYKQISDYKKIQEVRCRKHGLLVHR